MRAPSLAPEQRHAVAIAAILLLLLALTSALTLQALSAARSHRRVAEQALQDFAGVAAWSFRTRTEALLFNAMVTLFRDVGGRLPGSSRQPDPTAATVNRAVDRVRACSCALVIQPRVTFVLDLASGRLDLSGPIDNHERDELTGALREDVAGRYANEWDFAVKPLPGQPTRVLFYTVQRTAAGDPRWALGFEADSVSLREEFFDVIAREYRALAPVTDIPNDSLASVVVRTAEGDLLFASPTSYQSSWRGQAALGQVAGALQIEVTISPAVAGRLLPGTGSTLSARGLLALLAATIALLASAGLFAYRAAVLARARARFTAAVSHELKTPLAEILLYAETIALGRLRHPVDYQREAGVVVDEARHLIAMIDNVLHAGHVGQPSLQIHPRPLDLGAVAGAAVASSSGRADRHGVDLSLQVEPGLAVEADPDALKAILRNLIDNALKYGGNTPVEIQVERFGEWCRLSVEDGGPGIPERDRARVWQLFARLETNGAHPAGGSGIGLAVVRDLTRRHGGRVAIETGRRGGARVIVDLPARGTRP